MGRFESPMQVVGLFLAASVVSVGVTFFVNAEAHSRQSAKESPHHGLLHPSLPEPSFLRENPGSDVDETRHAAAPAEINGDASLTVAARAPSLSELSYIVSNYTNSPAGATPPPSSSSSSTPLFLGGGSTNVTLLNFLEDGLEKLLSLIKQAKNTYKSYYVQHDSLQADHFGKEEKAIDASAAISSPATYEKETLGQEVNDNNGIILDDNHLSFRMSQHPRRRKKREVATLRNGNVGGSRSKRALVISPPNSSSKRRRVGENEPYYWQMLDDNNHHNNEHYHHSKNNQKEPAPISGAAHHHYHLQRSSRDHNHQQQQHHSHNSHYVYGAGENAPVVASAFTGGNSASSATSGDNININNNNNNNHGSVGGGGGSPTSDFHKIRHAVNKLGGGGLDFSVVERMILDKKPINRERPPSPPLQQPHHNNHNNHQHHHQNQNPQFGPSSRINQVDIEQHSRIISSRNRDNSHNIGETPTASNTEDNSLPPAPSSSSTSLLTTAVTKTTHPGRQDESLYVNQLRHQQQQLAQSLLPPTVTWLSNNNNNNLLNGAGVLQHGNNENDEDNEESESEIRFLPLPSSSLATGSAGDRFHEEHEENSVDSFSKMDKKKKETKEKRRKKGKKNQKSNELLYSQSSLIDVKDESEEGQSRTGDYPLFPYKNSNDDSGERDRSSSEEGPPGLEDETEDENENGQENRSGSDRNNNYNDNYFSGSDGRRNNINNLGDGAEEGEEDEIDNDNAEEEERLGFGEGEEDFGSFGSETPPSPSLPPQHNHNNHESGGGGGKDCYRTDDVLIVVAITCCLNFAFVLVIWALVRWFSISSNPKEKDFQNLGDCDDALDPTIVFHGVTEDPCWSLATKEAAAASASGAMGTAGRGERDNRGDGGGTTRRGGGVGCGGDGRDSGGAGGVGFLGTIGSIHSTKKLDLFPMAKHHMGGGGILGGGGLGGDVGGVLNGAGSNGTIGGAVMSMTTDRRGLYHQNLSHYYGGGLAGGTMFSSGSGAGIYSFRPEHVVPPSGTSGSTGGMTRSYSQSMEDLRYLQ